MDMAITAGLLVCALLLAVYFAAAERAVRRGWDFERSASEHYRLRAERIRGQVEEGLRREADLRRELARITTLVSDTVDGMEHDAAPDVAEAYRHAL